MSMDIVLCLVAIICTYRIKFASEWHSDYMSKEKTTAINGIFVLFVFFRHFTQYIEYGSYDAIFQRVDSWLGQLIVVSFFFYSGYGGMVSIVKKGGGLYSYNAQETNFPCMVSFCNRCCNVCCSKRNYEKFI